MEEDHTPLVDHRNPKYDQPPAFLAHKKGHSNAQSNDKQPLIGILTHNTDDKEKKFLGIEKNEPFILEANENFIRWGGSKPVAIPFDISDDELDKLLPQINGVLLPGAVTALGNATDDSPVDPFDKLTAKMMAYSKDKKDKENEEWPVMGICMHFWFMIMEACDKDESIKGHIRTSNEQRRVYWETPYNQSRLF